MHESMCSLVGQGTQGKQGWLLCTFCPRCRCSPAPAPEARVRRAEAGDLLFYERGSEQRLLLLERAAPWLAPYSHLFASCEVDRVLRALLRQPVGVGNRPLNTLELRLELPDTGE